MMDDLISMAALKADIQAILNDSTCPLHIAAEVEQYIEMAPAVDAVPLVHGRWIDYKDEHQCSKCRESVVVDYYVWKNIQYDYCPNCGAKMDGERREANETGRP